MSESGCKQLVLQLAVMAALLQHAQQLTETRLICLVTTVAASALQRSYSNIFDASEASLKFSDIYCTYIVYITDIYILYYIAAAIPVPLQQEQYQCLCCSLAHMCTDATITHGIISNPIHTLIHPVISQRRICRLRPLPKRGQLDLEALNRREDSLSERNLPWTGLGHSCSAGQVVLGFFAAFRRFLGTCAEDSLRKKRTEYC